MGVWSLLGMFVYTLGEFYVFELRTGLGFVNTWRSYVWIPIVLQGYLVSMASFQSFLIVASRAGQRVPSPRVANTTFLVVLGAMTVSLAVTDTVLAVGWQELWRAISALRALLAADASAWSEERGTDVGALLALLPHFNQLAALKAVAYKQQVGVLVTLIASCFLVALANVGSSLLLLSIRRQISSHTARLQQLASPLAQATFSLHMNSIAVVLPAPRAEVGADSGEHTYQGESRVEWGSPLSAVGSEGEHKAAVAWNGELASPAYPAKAQAQADGDGDGPDEKWWARARRKSSVASAATVVESEGLRSLRRAERELVVCVVSVLFFSLSYLGEVAWDLITLRDDLSWYALELSYFFVAWTFALGMSFMVSVLCVLAGREWGVVRRRAARDAIAVASGAGLGFAV